MVEGGSVQPLQATARRIGFALAIAAIGIVVAAASAAPASARPDCVDAILVEWTNGALTAKHPIDCYEAAIDALPEDLRSYTSAAEDISRALTAANRSDRQLTAAPVTGESEDVRAFPAFVVVLTALAGLLAASGLAASLIRRRRAR